MMGDVSCDHLPRYAIHNRLGRKHNLIERRNHVRCTFFPSGRMASPLEPTHSETSEPGRKEWTGQHVQIDITLEDSPSRRYVPAPALLLQQDVMKVPARTDREQRSVALKASYDFCPPDARL